MKKYIPFLLVILTIVAILAACTAGGDGTTDTTPSADTTAETVSDTSDAGDTTAPTDTDTDSDTDSETDIDTETDTETDTEPPLDVLYVPFDHARIIAMMSTANGVKQSRFEDPDKGPLLKLTAPEAKDDLYIALNFRSLRSAAKLGDMMAEDYDYLILDMRAENCYSSNFELLYGAGKELGISGRGTVYSQFDNAYEGWQYLVFDMTGAAEWEGLINAFRFDYQPDSQGMGETVYLAGMYFAKNLEEMNAVVRQNVEDPFVVETDPEAESQVADLMATPDKAPAVDNTKVDAQKEDKNLDLWFNHAYTKTPAEDIKSTGWNSYMMRLAKNEAEGVHLLLASATGHNGLTVSVSDFTNAAGATLKTDLYYGYYFDDVDGQTIVDPIPLVKEGQTFDLSKGRSYMFIIKATSAVDSPAGEYTATVTVKDASGNEIKKAIVKAYVWNFVLPEETTLKTQMDLAWYNIYVTHECYAGDDSVLYKNYYDLLLSNRVCAYTLPYATGGTYADDRIVQYLDNPRVVAFNPIDWKTFDFDRIGYSTEVVQTSYAFLAANQKWLDKSYFYVVDEPSSKADLDKINLAGDILKEHFPGYKMLSPMHYNYALTGDGSEDYISYIKDAINVWCYKPFFHTTYAQYCYDRSLTYRATPAAERYFGPHTERMEKEQAEGDEVWWYVTRRPENPEITLLMDTESVRHRILFWQQKLYNVDGFLYYLVNDWYGLTEYRGLDKKHETNGGADYFDCYGNGVLLYCGADFDVYGPVSSVRLENVRDGIEDFEYLTMLEKTYGKEVTDALIHRLTTSLTRYNMDIDNFTDLRIALGNIIEAAGEGSN